MLAFKTPPTRLIYHFCAVPRLWKPVWKHGTKTDLDYSNPGLMRTSKIVWKWLKYDWDVFLSIEFTCQASNNLAKFKFLHVVSASVS